MSSVVEFSSEMSVNLIDVMGTDLSVVEAARISTVGSAAVDSKESAGLINYLMRARHGSPFEHATFKWVISTPIFVSREFMRHRIASYNEQCLSGTTIVTRLGKNNNEIQNKKNSSLEVLYRNWHDGVLDSKGRIRLLDSCKSIYVRSYDEANLSAVKSKVLDIKKNGVKKTWLVTTESGKCIRSTKDHKYFTPNGWKRLNQLNVGDYLYRTGRVRVSGEPSVPMRLRQGIQFWTTQQKQFLIPDIGCECYVCDNHISFEETQIDHVIPVVLNLAKALDINNLKGICKKCHRDKTNNEQKYASRLGTTSGLRLDKIISIDNALEEMTYDLVLEDPHHNFLANGLVVHNSGRYMKLSPKFYIPDGNRKLIQTGKTGDYVFESGSLDQFSNVRLNLIDISQKSWIAYEEMLAMGIANEVARMALPVNIYTNFYVTMNARALMNFLSLRVLSDDALYPSTPQIEIHMVAEQMEKDFKRIMPLTYASFLKNGRVAP